jgi:hypothetical protein
MAEESYDTALYLHEFGNNSNYISNDGIISGRIDAFLKDDLYMRLNLSRVSIERGSFLDLYYYDTLYIITSGEIRATGTIYSMSFDTDYQKLSLYLVQNNIDFALEKNNIKGNLLRGKSGLRPSQLFASLDEKRYKVYDNGEITLYHM